MSQLPNDLSISHAFQCPPSRSDGGPELTGSGEGGPQLWDLVSCGAAQISSQVTAEAIIVSPLKYLHEGH